MAYDKEREDNVQKSRTTVFEDRLKRQVGVRWLVEGMVGGNLAAIESYNFQPVQSESKVPREQYERLFDRLRTKSTILVGHNVFIDLIYFYACFFGKLPDSVKDFERCMHELFPCIIDTKYLATHGNDNPAMSKSSLEELDEQLSGLTPAPVIGKLMAFTSKLKLIVDGVQRCPMSITSTSALNRRMKLVSIAI